MKHVTSRVGSKRVETKLVVGPGMFPVSHGICLFSRCGVYLVAARGATVQVYQVADPFTVVRYV